MSAGMRAALTEVAERAPAIAIPVGVFDRARRAHRRRKWLNGAAVLLVLGAAGAFAGLETPPPPAAVQPDRVDEMPAYVVNPPGWTARIQDAPLPRALVAFRSRDAREITLVGPADQYRSYDPGEGEGFELSPDGRYLMTGHGQRTRLLDVVTGETRVIELGAPLSWAADSREAVLIRYDGESENTFPVTGELMIVDMPSGELVWSMTLDPGPLPRDIYAALSPDGTTLAVKRLGNFYAQGIGEGFRRPLYGVSGIRAPVSWSPDGKTLAVDCGLVLCLVNANTGDEKRRFRIDQLADRIGVVSWEPLAVNTGAEIVCVEDQARRLLRGPEGSMIRVATVLVDWTEREPGEPDAGPLWARSRGSAEIGLGAFVAGGLVVLWLIRRRGRSRAWR